MTQPFYRKEDINMRLVNGVVMARGEPVLLTEYDGTHLYGETLYGIPMSRIKLEEVDIDPVHTGNVFTGDSYVYTSRMPQRKYKQSLANESLVCHEMPFPCERVTARRMFQPILNQYKSFPEVLKLVVDGAAKAMPFHRDWGLYKDGRSIKLCYKDMEVGVVRREVVQLIPEKFYLEQSLKEIFDEQV